jgi:hypothetical protein
MAAYPDPGVKGTSQDARAFPRKLDWIGRSRQAGEAEQAHLEEAVGRLIYQSEGSPEKAQRAELFQLYLRLYSDLQASIGVSAEKRRQSRTWGRALVAVSSLAAALAGLALALNYHGFGSRAFGIAAAAAGTWTTISTSLRLDEEHTRNARRNRAYRRLMRELQLYLVASFPTVSPEDAASRLMDLSRDYEDIETSSADLPREVRASSPP